MNFTGAMLLFPLFLLSLLLLWRMRLLDSVARMLTAFGLLLGAFALRWAMLDYETLDYQNFLTGWVAFFRANGGFAALAEPVGNYNVPYLYFLALFSYSSLRDLYLIKALSVLFDVVLAWAVTLLVGVFHRGKWRRLLAFLVTLWLPTVVLNGALWGQCDVIYTALLVLGLALALRDRPVLCLIAMAGAFAFKLQAVFLLPILAVLWMRGKLRWYHLPVFPAAYVAIVLPAVLAGRPFWSTLTLYFSQIGSTGSGLNYNSPSLFALLPGDMDAALGSRLGLAAAAVWVLGLLGLCLLRRRQLSDRATLLCALLLAVGVPFLLPHMHERYFFAADALSLALAFILPGTAPLAALTSFASLLGYHAYLRMRYLLPMAYGAQALIPVLLVLLGMLLSALRPTKPKNRRISS